MGQTLSEPVTDKHTNYDQDSKLSWAVSEMQGWRLTMEDSHCHLLQLGDDKTSFFAVYDGHGGSTVARFAGSTLAARLASTPSFKARDFPTALSRAFLATDEDLRANPDFIGDPSGCTAVAVIVDHEGAKITCANAGDSRSVLSLAGVCKPLSYDHKPTNFGENERIVAGGGYVQFGRVNGNLALSRALGDFEFKQNSLLDAQHQIVTADPDVIVHDICGEEEFVVIACDGIWDVLSSQTVISLIRRLIALRTPLATICEMLITKCLAPDSDWGGIGCDNMTILIVATRHGRTEEEWYDWVSERVAKGDDENGSDESNNEYFRTPKDFLDPFAAGPRGGAFGSDDQEEEDRSLAPAPGGGDSSSLVQQLLREAIKSGTIGAPVGRTEENVIEEVGAETTEEGLKKTSLSPPEVL